jgi:hypothetical protein
MTHLPYIIPSFLIGILLPLAMAILAARRLSAAQRRLALLEPRRRKT